MRSGALANLRAWTVIVACSITAIAHADEPTGWRYDELRSWRARDGLPATAVQSLLASRDGYLVLGLHGAVARFDGARFTPLELQPPLPPECEVRGLFEDADGTLWVATMSRGLARVAPSGETTWSSVAEGLPAPNVAAVCRDGAGTLWAATTAGLAQERAGRFQVAARDALRDVIRLRCNSDGVWALPREGPPRHVTATGATEPALAWDERLHGEAMHADAHGRLWIGARDGRVLNAAPAGFEQVELPERLRNTRINDLLLDHGGALWIASDGVGVARLRPGSSWEFASVDEGFASARATSLVEDAEGDVWIATTGGLTRVTDRPFFVLRRGRGLPVEPTGPVLASGADVHVAVIGGLATWRNDRVAISAVGAPIIGLASGPGEAVTVGKLDGWLRMERGVPRPWALDFGESGAHPAVPLLNDRAGRLWLQDARGLLVAREGRVRRLGAAEGLSSLYNVALVERRDGSVWLGSDGRLFRTTGAGEAFQVVADVGPRADTPILALLDARDGSLWGGTADGLFSLRQGKLRRFGAPEGIPPMVNALAEDDDGHLWAGTRQGLLRVTPSASEERPTVLRWGTEAGLATGDFSRPARPSATRAADGTLWFSASDEIVVVSPSRVRVDERSPRVFIETLTVDGSRRPLASRVALGPGRHRVELTYTAPRLRTPARLRFRHRLDGDASGWSDVGDERQASFANLSPGAYRFVVQARAGNGAWSAPAALAFTVAPRLHETLTFRALAALTFLVLLPGLFHLVRVRRMRAKFAALEAERNRIARELHDTLEQSLTGLALHLKAAETRLPGGDGPAAAARRHVGAARAIARFLKTDARHVVWDLRGRGGTHGDLVSALKQTVLQAQATEAVSGTVEVTGTPRALDAAVETALLRIAQEALTNALKHARATQVSLALTFGGRDVTLAIRDDGAGFDAAAPPGTGLGLRGMRERADAIGAAFRIDSGHGAGTTVHVQWKEP